MNRETGINLRLHSYVVRVVFLITSSPPLFAAAPITIAPLLPPAGSPTRAVALCSVPDVDGDLMMDVVVGFHTSGVERAHLFSGNTGGYGGVSLAPPDGISWGGGLQLGWVPDVTGDGIVDLLVSAYTGTSGTDPDVTADGIVFVYDGADGSLLRTLAPPQPKNLSFFGLSVCGLVDFTGDGRGDIAVGEPLAAIVPPSQGSDGAVHLYNGVTGGWVRTLVPPTPNATLNARTFGAFLAAMDDQNGDGWPDIAVGAPNHEGFDPVLGVQFEEGRVFVMDPRTGQLHSQIAPVPPAELLGLGHAFVVLPDRDGDNRNDLAVASPREAKVGVFASTGARILEIPAPVPHELLKFGSDIARLGDVSGDGIDELLVSDPWATVAPGLDRAGAIYLIDGATGSSLAVWLSETPQAVEHFGGGVVALGDTTGDTIPEFVVIDDGIAKLMSVGPLGGFSGLIVQ